MSAWVLMAMLEQARAWDRVQGLPPESKAEVLHTLDTIKASAIHWSENSQADDLPARRPTPSSPAEPLTTEVEGHGTAVTAAQRLGCTERRVRQMVKEGKLSGRRIGGTWFIEDQSVDDYLLRKDVA
ncbi:helix-turn-helix domain-containing protein [Pseudarthrobacter equi]|uniref:helix-turn-helix domain-containing protein n=1 Tax=Pseudarthrobacter equi TaxID=728066 RepID=UPI0021BF460F|nr:helix-turn-helix domain-containing protein [Pseudarthrobacter equi]MCT9624257.1 helix-turn-helix domain-containing protein [Pseudarthrobacter equi]